ncbi:TonB-dependent siderophore receptor [Oceanicoccus sp. KOV_DT_Chl]|uniref:TonB-dependent receptor plug domain-containing protein n=1 Tax=Oceanicoccus sp. KOV_DT_Chl TaxID=1904639 RepID=UPI000C7AADEE|nr:TonB-dependent receptor [Oceanicoccus sp. KOV_DT_Chl]
MKQFNRTALHKAVVIAAVSIAPLSVSAANEGAELEEVIVQGAPVYRDRTPSVSPELEYDTEFFQQFEPTSVGDMLKRTPGVAFSSDVGEYDSPQLRGLGAGYTQVLINGRRIAGSSADRSAAVDRIPAEMVDRIQIIRSPSADQDSQGVGGTINIILKDGASLQGGSIRLGVLSFDDNKYRNSAALSYGAQTNDVTWSTSATFSERYVAKQKTETVTSPEGELDTREIEHDVRDSDDISLSAAVTFQLDENSTLGFSANKVITERTENQTEEASEVNDDGDLELDGLARDAVDIEEDTLTLGTLYTQKFGQSSNWEISADYSKTEQTEDADLFERDDYESIEEYDGIENLDISDEEFIVATSVGTELNSGIALKTGLVASMKEREETYTEFDVESDGFVNGVDLLQTYEVEEDRLDAFLLGETALGESGILELGVRVESTDRTIENEVSKTDTSETHVNPSAHFSYEVGDRGTFRTSLARTVRRPAFTELSPTILEDEPEDGDAKQGNPDLDDEVSNGLDIGYEQRILGRGIAGFNVFYREVSDVIEEVGITRAGGGTLYSYNNAGDGEVWGVEMDFNVPISDQTGFFANVTWLDSEIEDQFTGETRRFRDQPNYVYNVGITHNIPSWDVSTGFSYQQQGKSLQVDLDREVELEYDGNLEAFIEKRFDNDYVLRLTGTNLLDAEKREHFTNYGGDSAQEILDNHIAGDVDEFEDEVETAGPVITLTLRKRF